MTNNFFAWHRFWCYFKKLWMEHRSQFYIATGITFGVLLMVMLATFFLTCSYNDGEALANYQVIGMAETISGWASFIYTIVMIVAASQFFSDGKLKSGRIHVLTTPVSMFENWLARVCLFVVAYIIMFHVVFNVVELLRALLMTTVHYEGSMLWGGIGHISFYSDQYWEIWFYFTAFYAFLITTYMLGSVVFLRRSLLLTTITLLILLFTGGIFTLFIGVERIENGLHFFYWLAFLSVANLWLSYRRLCEMEIKNRR